MSEPIKKFALDMLARAGYEKDHPIYGNILSLVDVYSTLDLSYERKSNQGMDWDSHETSKLFAKLVRFENLPDKRGVGVAIDYSALRFPWQRFILDKIKREDYTNFPESVSEQVSMWKYCTYDMVLSDVVNTGGCMCAALLSMLYRPKVIVEMGVHAGFTTMLFCELNPDAIVHGVDLHSRCSDNKMPTGYAAMMQDVRNLRLHFMNSWEFDLSGKVDLCFVDANHSLPDVKLDTERAWENRNNDGEWCIAWDDYHPANPDVYNTVNGFCAKVGMPLNKINAWYYIGTKSMSERELENFSGDVRD